MNLKIIWLRERFGWMGKHSGYDQICEAIAKIQPNNYHSIWKDAGKRLPKGSQYAFKRIAPKAKSKTGPKYDIYCAAAEVEVLWKSLFYQPDLVHLNYVDNNFGILPDWKQRLNLKIVGTAHQPASWWRLWHSAPESVAALDALIVPASREVSYFERYLPGRVYFVPHGVDTSFFRPSSAPGDFPSSSDYPRCIFSGKWLRDFSTLAGVVQRVLAQNPRVQFDIILPKNSRSYADPTLLSIAQYEQVHWYAGVSDGELLKIYQTASMLVLPLLDCTANNALLEAIACGLPVISNRIGGLPDYTRDSFADLLPVGDVEGMANAVLRLADDFSERKHRGIEARLFAEQNLTWEKIAAQTLEVYTKVIASHLP
jgi:glycosyltransferase involved in cell wall biosynthesis